MYAYHNYSGTLPDLCQCLKPYWSLRICWNFMTLKLIGVSTRNSTYLDMSLLGSAQKQTNSLNVLNNMKHKDAKKQAPRVSNCPVWLRAELGKWCECMGSLALTLIFRLHYGIALPNDLWTRKGKISTKPPCHSPSSDNDRIDSISLPSESSAEVREFISSAIPLQFRRRSPFTVSLNKD